jgi:hypothetical protein
MRSDVFLRMFTTGGIQKPGNLYSWNLQIPVFFPTYCRAFFVGTATRNTKAEFLRICFKIVHIRIERKLLNGCKQDNVATNFDITTLQCPESPLISEQAYN